MSKLLPTHAAWLGFALITFLIGRSLVPSASLPPEATHASPTKRSPTALGRTPSGPQETTSELDTRHLIKRTASTTDAVESAIEFARLLRHLTPENAHEIVTTFSGSPEQRRVLRYAWGKIDGESATAYATENFGGEKLGVLLNDITPGWGCGDPEGAIAWFDGAGLTQVHEALRRTGTDVDRFTGMLEEKRPGLIAGIADRDPYLATDYAYELTIDGNRDRAIWSIANRLVRQEGGARAGEWAQSLPDGELKGFAVSKVASAWAKAAPDAAAAWAERHADVRWALGGVRDINRSLSRP